MLPYVKDARVSERDAYMEFMGQFNSQDRDAAVSEHEFVELHRALSVAVSNDAEFASVVRGMWNA